MYWLSSVLFDHVRKLLSEPKLVSYVDGHIAMADFVAFYEAGKLFLLSGTKHTGAYEFANQLLVQSSVIQPLQLDRVLLIPYPPTFYSLMAPFSVLSLGLAYKVWVSLTFILGSIVLVWYAANQKKYSKLDLFLLWAAATVSLPGQLTLHLGQMMWLLLAIACLYFHYLSKRRDLIAGLCLAALCIKPTFAVFFVIPALAQRRWKLVVAAVIGLAIFSIPAFIMMGWDCWWQYGHYLITAENSAKYWGNVMDFQVSLIPWIFVLLGHRAGMIAGLSLIALSLGFLFYVWDKTEQVSGRAADTRKAWAIAMTVVVSLLFSPHANIHDCLFLIIAAVLTLPSTSWANTFRLRPLSVRIWMVSLSSYVLINFIVMLLFPYSSRPLFLLALNAILFVSCFAALQTRITEHTAQDTAG